MGPFFSHKVPCGASLVWKRIISSREALAQGTCYKLGDGLVVNPWRDPWIPCLPNHIPKFKEGINGEF